jgi:DNA-binding transcriptional regulator LsrR (DeoR family)
MPDLGRPDEGGPASQVLLASVARRYYLSGRSKVQIAEELGLSRFQVARMLDRALATGLVRIEIGGGRAGSIDLDTSSRLQDAYGLRHSVVVDVPADPPAALRARLGAAAAELLMEVVTPSDVLGVAWARAVSTMAAAVTRLPPVPVVQLTGALSGHGIEDSAVELVRNLSRTSGGPAYFFYAPMIVRDATTAAALHTQPEVARTFGMFDEVTKAVVGIGLWEPGGSTVYDSASPSDRRLLHDLGTCAETSGALLTADGDPVHSPVTERMIAIGAEQLRAVPEVIGVPYGVPKAVAVRAALRSGVVTSLVTHTSLAAALLDLA